MRADIIRMAQCRAKWFDKSLISRSWNNKKVHEILIEMSLPVIHSPLPAYPLPLFPPSFSLSYLSVCLSVFLSILSFSFSLVFVYSWRPEKTGHNWKKERKKEWKEIIEVLKKSLEARLVTPNWTLGSKLSSSSFHIKCADAKVYT